MWFIKMFSNVIYLKKNNKKICLIPEDQKSKGLVARIAKYQPLTYFFYILYLK